MFMQIFICIYIYINGWASWGTGDRVEVRGEGWPSFFLGIWEVTPNRGCVFKVLNLSPEAALDLWPGCTKKRKMGSLSGHVQASGLWAGTAPPVTTPDGNRTIEGESHELLASLLTGRGFPKIRVSYYPDFSFPSGAALIMGQGKADPSLWPS